MPWRRGWAGKVVGLLLSFRTEKIRFPAEAGLPDPQRLRGS